MSQSRAILTLSLLAVAAISSRTFVTAAGGVGTAKGNALGVACSDGAIGDLVPTDVLGTTQVIASAAIAKGASIQVAANGQAATATSGAPVVAVALQAATAAGDVIEVFLIPNAPAVA